jgi:hypothetical protein
MWPDWASSSSSQSSQASGATGGAAGQESIETFMFAPPWLVGSFQGRGRLGYWGQLTRQRPQQVGLTRRGAELHGISDDVLVQGTGLLGPADTSAPTAGAPSASPV